MFLGFKFLLEPTLSMDILQQKFQHFYTAEYLAFHLLILAYAYLFELFIVK